MRVSYLFLLGLCSGVVGLFGPAGEAFTAPFGPEEILAVLKARDAQFDNVSLRYVRSGELTQEPKPMWKMGNREQRQDQRPAGPIKIPYRSEERMTVRGPNVTFDRQIKATAAPAEDPDIQFVPQQKWSNAEGQVRELSDDYKEGVIGSRVMEIKRNEGASALVAEQLMEIEFGFGLGFGKRIKKVNSVKQEGDNRVVEGTIKLWREDISRFRIETDRDFVVRKAVIDADVHGNLTRYEVKTRGAVARDGLVFAETGHVKRTWRGFRQDGKILGEPKVQNEFNLLFKDVQFNLSDMDYARLTNMDVPPETVLIDRTSGEQVYINAQGERQSLAKPNTAARSNGPMHGLRFYLIVVLIHAVVVLAVVLFLMARRRWSQKTDTQSG